MPRQSVKAKATTDASIRDGVARLFGAAAGPAKKRKRLTVPQKKELLELLATGVKHEDAARAFGIGLRTVERVSQDKSKIRDSKSTTTHLKSGVRVGKPVLEEQLLDHMDRLRHRGLPVSQQVVKVAATRIVKRLVQQYDQASAIEDARRAVPGLISSKEADKLRRFTVTDNGVIRFLRRHDKKSVALHGAAGDEDEDEAREEFVEQLTATRGGAAKSGDSDSDGDGGIVEVAMSDMLVAANDVRARVSDLARAASAGERKKYRREDALVFLTPLLHYVNERGSPALQGAVASLKHKIVNEVPKSTKQASIGNFFRASRLGEGGGGSSSR